MSYFRGGPRKLALRLGLMLKVLDYLLERGDDEEVCKTIQRQGRSSAK